MAHWEKYVKPHNRMLENNQSSPQLLVCGQNAIDLQFL